MSKEDFLSAEGQTQDEFDADIEKTAREAMATQLVLDAVVEKEQLSVNEAELTEHLVRTASRYGMGPDEFAQQVVSAGQVPMLVNEVVRGKALALVLEKATVTDESGRPVDLEELREDATADDVLAAGDGLDEDAELDGDAGLDEDAEQADEQREAGDDAENAPA
jgi:trigger factor